MTWKKLVTEASTPSDKDSIIAALHKDVSDEKLSVTTEFLETAYKLLNQKYFKGELPTNIAFKVKVQARQTYVGQASYVYDLIRGTLHTTSVTLNGSRTLTLHEWLEVVLHEMIHVLDYETNPDHFMVGSYGRYYKRKHYDPHGYWFMEQGEKFESEGFHVQKFCKADVGVNADDRSVKKRVDNSVFVYMMGDANYPYIMKMSRKNLDTNLEYIVNRIGKGGSFGAGVNELYVATSENPNIALLRDLRMRDSTSRISWWWFTDDFRKKYGPFKEEDCIHVMRARKSVAAEGDDGPEEVEPETAEEVADEIQDNIESVQDVTPISDDKVLVSIA